MSTLLSADEFLKSGKYLPPVLRDFHDAKDVFKTMHGTMDMSKNTYCKDVTWTAGQCYVIDCFLWFMARRGYTLQRSRANVEFRDLADDIKTHRDTTQSMFAAMIEARKTKTEEEIP